MLKIIRFIEESLESDQCLLIHSFDGTSRALIVFAAYLVFRFHWPPQRALQFIATKRFTCNPRNSFVRQLIEWAGRLRKARGEFRDIFAPNISHLRLCPEEHLHRNTFLNAVYAQPKPETLSRKPKSHARRLQWIDAGKRVSLVRPPTPSYRSMVPAMSDPVEVDPRLPPTRSVSPGRNDPPRAKTPPPVPILAARPAPANPEPAKRETSKMAVSMDTQQRDLPARPSSAARRTPVSRRPTSASQLPSAAHSNPNPNPVKQITTTARRRVTGRYRPPTPPRRPATQKSVSQAKPSLGPATPDRPHSQTARVESTSTRPRTSILSQSARPVLLSSRSDGVRASQPRLQRTAPVAVTGYRDRQAASVERAARFNDRSTADRPVVVGARPASTGRLPVNRPASAVASYGRATPTRDDRGARGSWSSTVRTGSVRPASAGRPARTTPSIPNNLSRSLSVRATSEIQGSALLAQSLSSARTRDPAPRPARVGSAPLVRAGTMRQSARPTSGRLRFQ